MLKRTRRHIHEQGRDVTKPLKNAATVGIAGALIWSALGYIFYWLKFTKVSPSFVVDGIVAPGYLHRWEGILTALSFLTVISLAISVVYAYTLSRFYSPWPGVAMGLLLWFLFFSWRDFDQNTQFTWMSLFTLYGVFVGYSLSIEFSKPEEERTRK